MVPNDVLHEARFYEKKANKTVRCLLCHRFCTIPEGKTGFCKVRKNIGGKLYALTYGKPCSFEVDPIEKKPFFHFNPGSLSYSIATVGCNFACLHCQNWEISQAFPGDVPEFDLPPEKVVQSALIERCHEIAYTYTEPTIFFEYCEDTAKIAKKHNLYNVFVSNGYFSEDSRKELFKFLDGIRIDLKGDENFYRKIAGGAHLEPVLENIEKCAGKIHLEVITLLIPGKNTDEKWISDMTDYLSSINPDIPWHFTRFYPAYKMLDVSPTAIEDLERAHSIASKKMNYVYIGNVLGHEFENTFCPSCGKKVIERFGFSIVGWHLDEKNKCIYCGQNIPIFGRYYG
ncbi:MAG: AmmeMemoRadiSam system radical SAM enzyme [archaeon]